MIDKHNDNNKEFCENKYKSPDCSNQYYKIKLITEQKLNVIFPVKWINWFLQYVNNRTFKSSNENTTIDINLISSIFIYINNEPDTIYSLTISTSN